MIKVYGQQPPATIDLLKLGGICPHCKTGTRFTRVSQPDGPTMSRDQVRQFTADYICDVCLKSIPVLWDVVGFSGAQPILSNPREVLPAVEPFDFTHVPQEVEKEIREGLACLSVGAFNGFAALCRRTIQAICVNLGANATTKVKAQIEEMIGLTGLGDEWKDLTLQIMFAGHDGSHPHLPDVNADRAAVLLSLIRDLTYQLYTRPGKVKEAALLRRDAIEAQKQS